MIDINTCRYTTLIKNYKLLNTPDSEITKKRTELLNKLYMSCSDEQRDKFIKHIEEILASRLVFPFRIENPNKMVDFGTSRVLKSKNKERLGECLPIVLVLEKELINIIKPEEIQDYDISIWVLNYLKKYDKRLCITKDSFDEYDVLYSYSRLGLKGALFKAYVFSLKFSAIFVSEKEK